MCLALATGPILASGGSAAGAASTRVTASHQSWKFPKLRPNWVDPGNPVTLVGVLSVGAKLNRHRTVELLARPLASSHKHYRVVATGRTNRQGSVTFSPVPTVSSAYRLRAHKTAHLASIASPTHTVVVRSQECSLVVDSVTKGDDNGPIVAGHLLLDGKPPTDRQVVRLSGADPGASHFGFLTDVLVTSNGQVFAQPGAVVSVQQDYRLIYRGDRFHGRCKSAPVTFPAS
jgi:hypothetical protein